MLRMNEHEKRIVKRIAREREGELRAEFTEHIKRPGDMHDNASVICSKCSSLRSRIDECLYIQTQCRAEVKS